MVRRRIVEKVRKCLALARSDAPNEAATALRQARALMAEHGIEERLVDVEGVRTANGRGETAARWRVMLGEMVCDAFGLRMIQIPRRGRSEVEFIGKVPRPEIGAYAFDVLRRQLESGRRKFLQGLRCRRATKTRRGDLFAEGWISAVRGKVKTLWRTGTRKGSSKSGSVGSTRCWRIWSTGRAGAGPGRVTCRRSPAGGPRAGERD